MGHLLGLAVERTLSHVGAMISAIVIYLNANDAGPGFYALAIELGMLPSRPSPRQKEAFWADQVGRVLAHYAGRS